MRTAAIPLASLLALLVAACGEGGSDRGRRENEASAAGAGAERIAHMSEAERNAVFHRALADAGHDCQNVVSSKRAADQDGVPVWQAVCRGGRSWFVAVTSNGYAQILRPGPDETTDEHGDATRRP